MREKGEGLSLGVVVRKQESHQTVSLKNNRGTMTKLINAEVGSKNIDLHVNRIRPKSDVGLYHYHEYMENVYFILEGEITIRTPEGNKVVRKDEAAFIPPGVPHAVLNLQDVEAQVLEIYSPCRQNDFVVVDE